MAEYLRALANGTIIKSTYYETLNHIQVKNEICHVLNKLNLKYNCSYYDIAEYPELLKFKFDNCDLDTIYILAKGVTPGGRSSLYDEQRIQQQSKYFNLTYKLLQNNKNAVSLGIYREGKALIFCAWPITSSASVSNNITISRQIKIDTISNAIRNGICRQDKRNGNFALAFRPRFLHFYLHDYKWLHYTFSYANKQKYEKITQNIKINPFYNDYK